MHVASRLQARRSGSWQQLLQIGVPCSDGAVARGRELGPVIHELARFGVGDWADADAFGPPRRLLRGALLALMSPSELSEPSWPAEIRLAEGTIGLEVAARPPPAGR